VDQERLWCAILGRGCAP